MFYKTCIIYFISYHLPQALLGLAITLATILPSIIYKGGTISAIVVDSINWAANMTTVPPSRLLKPILNLLAHELCAYSRVLIAERIAYGQFQAQHNWPPHVIASHKEITHEFAESAATCPTFEKSKESLHFTFFRQKNNGDVGSTLVGVPWWLKRIGPKNPKSHSVRAPTDRNIKVPGPVTEARRQREQQEHHFLSMSLCFDSDVEHLTVIDPEREE